MKTSSRLPNAKPNGVGPLDGYVKGPVARPCLSTRYESIRLVSFSVTIKTSPAGLKARSAGAVPTVLKGRVEPAMGETMPRSFNLNPEMLSGDEGPPAFNT